MANLHARAPFGALALLLLCGCPPPYEPKKLEMEPIGTIKNVPTTPKVDNTEGDVTTPNSGTPSPGSTPCSGPELDGLEESLRQCEVTMPRGADVPSLKGKLEVKATTSTPTIAPGGRVDVLVTLHNTSSEPLALYFTGDPAPRFDVEAVDAKGRRADLPAGKWPGYPKGFKPEAREAKAMKVTLDKGGTARLKLTWDAVKTKWAPDRAKVWEGRGYPRTATGSLANGKYTLRVVLPMLGDVETPKVGIDVGG